MANLHDVQNLQMEDDNSFNSEVLWQRIPVETSFTKLPQVILGFQLLGVGVNAGELRIQIRMCSLYSCVYQSSNPWYAANRTKGMMIHPKLQRTLGNLKTSLAVMHLVCSIRRNPNQLCD